MTYEILIEGKPHKLELNQTDGRWSCTLDGKDYNIDAVLARRDVISLIVDGNCYEVKREQTPTDLHIWVKSVRFPVEIRDPRSLRSRRAAAGAMEGPAKLVAPMPGKVVRLIARERDEIEAGHGVLVVEAMKMQNELKSPKKGVVSRILVKEGAAVNAGDVLAIVE
ncbi:MAG TPA: biotin/lipoyl-containing protein [Terriglobales bacterium]|nr:biotin/lipoyl-containing protein [Terriglobales bacterium]